VKLQKMPGSAQRCENPRDQGFSGIERSFAPKKPEKPNGAPAFPSRARRVADIF
jgi:hypothetical protein